MLRMLSKILAAAFSVAVAVTAIASDVGAPVVPRPLPLELKHALSAGGQTYLIEADNEDNAGNGIADDDMGIAGSQGGCLYNSSPVAPIEFNFTVPAGSLPTTSATLLLETWDVDYPAERDEVFFNNTSVGVATGANDQWSNSLFSIPINLVTAGKNTVRVQIDTLNGRWCTWVRRAQLIIDGGTPGTASCRSITTSAPNYPSGATVGVTVEADTTLASQSLIFEVDLKNSNGLTVNGTSATATVTGALNDPQSFSIPLGSVPDGTYSATALLFDAGTNQFQATCSTQFTVGVPAQDVPTMSEWLQALMALMLALSGAWYWNRKRS